jgi:hypothetical protein
MMQEVIKYRRLHLPAIAVQRIVYEKRICLIQSCLHASSNNCGNSAALKHHVGAAL